MNDSSVNEIQEWQSSNPEFLNHSIQILLDHGFGKRDIYLFYRIDKGTRYIMFETVPEENRCLAAAMSVLSACILTFVDDIADQKGDLELLSQAERWMLSEIPPADKRLNALVYLWKMYLGNIIYSPNFQAYREHFFREWKYLFMGLFYSLKVNSGQPCSYGLQDYLQKLSPNSHVAVKHVIDVCYSPLWKPSNTAIAMQLANTVQVVIRIGNCLKSWKQELLTNRDITSGVCALAIDWQICSRQQLLDQTIPAEGIIEVINRYIHPDYGSNVPEYLYVLAQKRIKKVLEEPLYDEFINRSVYVEGLRKVMHDQAAGTNESR